MKYLVALCALILSFSCSNMTSTTSNGKEVILVPLGKGEKRSDHESIGKKYMIATQGKHSSLAAKKMFDLGGNIIDAAVAISFAISVERPQSTGLGGGGFLMYRNSKSRFERPLTYDFREKAPKLATKTMFLDKDGNEVSKKSIYGIFAAGVPGFVDGMMKIHREHGSLPLKTVMAPAIKLAKEGFKVYPELHKALFKKAEILKRYKASCAIFCDQNGEVLKEGDHLVQKDLANTLSLIAKKGSKAFYQGPIAKKIVKEFQRLKGLVTLDDLKSYKTKMRDPVKGTYKGKTVYSMSPPSSGGTHIIQILNIVEKDNLKRYGPQHYKTVHLTASAMQAAFSDRAEYMGDSDFVDVPVSRLISKKYASDIRWSIPESQALNKTWSSNEVFNKVKYESPETTHFTIMDAKGNVVVSTQTINGYFGSGVVVPGTGIVLNNEMDDFATKPGAKNLFGAVGGKNNLVEPEKRPLSSMSPTIVLENNKPILALGTPSGTRILSCVAQTILNYIEHELPLYDSVAASRFHHQWSPDEIRYDEAGLPKKTIKKLKHYRHQLRAKNLGCRIQAVSLEGDTLRGVSDPRGSGLALGL